MSLLLFGGMPWVQGLLFLPVFKSELGLLFFMSQCFIEGLNSPCDRLLQI